MAPHRAHIGRIPEHMRDELCRWIEEGLPHPRLLGSFTRALLSNDLAGAVHYADAVNRHALRELVQFVSSYAPADSWGSYEMLLAHHTAKELERRAAKGAATP